MKTTFSLISEAPPESNAGSPPSGELDLARRGPRAFPLELPEEFLFISATVFFLKG
jgi:hypothetical protein